MKMTVVLMKKTHETEKKNDTSRQPPDLWKNNEPLLEIWHSFWKFVTITKGDQMIKLETMSFFPEAQTRRLQKTEHTLGWCNKFHQVSNNL